MRGFVLCWLLFMSGFLVATPVPRDAEEGKYVFALTVRSDRAGYWGDEGYYSTLEKARAAFPVAVQRRDDTTLIGYVYKVKLDAPAQPVKVWASDGTEN